MWNGGRGGRNSTVPLHLGSFWTSKTPETWPGLNTTLVTFLSDLFSPTQHILLLFSFPHWPLCLPHPLCLLVLKIFDSWPSPSPPFVLPLPYPCSSLQLLSTELPHLVLHPGIFLQLLKAPSLPQPLCCLFTLFSPLQCPHKGRGALSEQEGVSLPSALVWQGPLRGGISRRSREPSLARPLWALLCSLHRQQELWPALTAGGIFGEG